MHISDIYLLRGDLKHRKYIQRMILRSGCYSDKLIWIPLNYVY